MRRGASRAAALPHPIPPLRRRASRPLPFPLRAACKRRGLRMFAQSSHFQRLSGSRPISTCCTANRQRIVGVAPPYNTGGGFHMKRRSASTHLRSMARDTRRAQRTCSWQLDLQRAPNFAGRRGKTRTSGGEGCSNARQKPGELAASKAKPLAGASATSMVAQGCARLDGSCTHPARVDRCVPCDTMRGTRGPHTCSLYLNAPSGPIPATTLSLPRPGGRLPSGTNETRRAPRAPDPSLGKTQARATRLHARTPSPLLATTLRATTLRKRTASVRRARRRHRPLQSHPQACTWRHPPKAQTRERNPDLLPLAFREHQSAKTCEICSASWADEFCPRWCLTARRGPTERES